VEGNNYIHRRKEGERENQKISHRASKSEGTKDTVDATCPVVLTNREPEARSLEEAELKPEVES
jgi:hypothetical protein